MTWIQQRLIRLEYFYRENYPVSFAAEVKRFNKDYPPIKEEEKHHWVYADWVEAVRTYKYDQD